MEVLQRPIMVGLVSWGPKYHPRVDEPVDLISFVIAEFCAANQEQHHAKAYMTRISQAIHLSVWSKHEKRRLDRSAEQALNIVVLSWF